MEVLTSNSKTNTKEIIGPLGVRRIMEAVESAAHIIPAVCIGGINHSNVQHVLRESRLVRSKINGAAVVSAIIAAPDPYLAAQQLKGLIDHVPCRVNFRVCDPGEDENDSPPHLGFLIWQVMEAIVKKTPKPISHNMTNLVLLPIHVVQRTMADHKQVVQNLAANVALCMGASPIMANYGEEAADLAKLGGALVINMGTVTPDGITNYIQALKAYNAAGRPVVFDPVGFVSPLPSPSPHSHVTRTPNDTSSSL